jgi:hypothetical protein
LIDTSLSDDIPPDSSAMVSFFMVDPPLGLAVIVYLTMKAAVRTQRQDSGRCGGFTIPLDADQSACNPKKAFSPWKGKRDSA